MRIITCVKCVPNALKADFARNAVFRDDVQNEMNPSDMFAIEEALRIKEKFPNSEVIGLSMGVLSTRDSLKKSIAMGLDDVYLLSDDCFSGSDTLATSYVLSCGIGYLGKYDLIICGRQSVDGDTGQVPQELSVALGVPCIINVVGLDIEEDKVICTVLSEKGYSKYTTPCPAVISVLKGINTPRIPTVSKLLRSFSYEVNVLNVEKLSVDISKCGKLGSPTKVSSISKYTSKKRAGVDISDDYLSIFDDLMKTVFCDEHQQVKNSKISNTLVKEVDCIEIWVVCEVFDNTLAEVSLQLLTKAFDISKNNGGIVVAIVFCSDGIIDEQLIRYGAEKIIKIIFTDDNHLFDERVPIILCKISSLYKPNTILLGGTTWGHWLAPLVSSRLLTGLTADCIDLSFDDKLLVQTRVALGGNLIADIICPNIIPQMATIREGVFKKRELHRSASVRIERYIATNRSSRIQLLQRDSETANQGRTLAESKVIIAGGRGLGSEANFKSLFEFSDLIGGMVAASRYAVDMGWVDYYHQVGQTGITVRPKLYIAFGISGAIEHIIGMRDSDCIITVNTDKGAPLISASDYCIYVDCNQVLKMLMKTFSN